MRTAADMFTMTMVHKATGDPRTPGSASGSCARTVHVRASQRSRLHTAPACSRSFIAAALTSSVARSVQSRPTRSNSTSRTSRSTSQRSLRNSAVLDSTSDSGSWYY